MKKLTATILLLVLLTGCSNEADPKNNVIYNRTVAEMETSLKEELQPIASFYDDVLTTYEACNSFNDFYDGYSKWLEADDCITHNGYEYYRVLTEGYETVAEFYEKMHLLFTVNMIDKLYSEERTARCFYAKDDGLLYSYWGSVGTRLYSDPQVTEITYDSLSDTYKVSVEYRNYIGTEHYGKTITHHYYFITDSDGLIKMDDILYGYDVIDNLH